MASRVTRIKARIASPFALIVVGELNERLAALISAEERGLLRARVAELLERGTFSEPSPDWPPLPWPLI